MATVADGLVTGVDPGTATITAAVEECPNITCDAIVTSYGSWIDTRVVVVDELDNTPVAGAAVVVGTEAPVVTDQLGIAAINFIDPGNPSDITVSHPEYNYVTLMGVESNDVMVHLRRLYQLDFSQQPPGNQAGGIKGKFNFDMIRCEPPLKTCDVSIALAGLSIPGNLINVCSDMIGGMINTVIELGGSKDTVPLPEGMVLCLVQRCYKEYYTPTGVPGNRVAWGLGGKVDLADLIDTFAGEGQNKNWGSMISDLVPLLANFYTSMVPNVDVVPRPMVHDGVDTDGDPETTEIPDYDNFPPQDMTLKVGMDQAVAVHPPTLPVGVYDGVFVIGGIIVRGAGFVPLGLGAGADSLGTDDIPDGQIEDPVVLHVADVAGRIPQGSFQRVVISLAVKLEPYDTDPGSRRWSGQVAFVDTFSGNLFLDDFLLPAHATYDPATKTLSVIGLPPGGDYSQAVFTGDSAAEWNVLGTLGQGDFTLSPDPDPANPRSAEAGFILVDLYDGMTYQDLIEFNGGNLGDLPYLMKAFSYTEVGAP